MSLSKKDQIHGAALMQLVLDGRFTALSKASEAYGHYLVRTRKYPADDALRELFTKYSTAAASPWQFTFHEDELGRIRKSEHRRRGLTFIALVCGMSGVCALTPDELWTLVHEKGTGQQQVRIERPRGGRFWATGTAGSLDYSVPASAFADLVLD